MKYVLITGSNGGMGRATSEIFIKNGYFVFGLDIVNNQDNIDSYLFIKTDLRDTSSINNAYEIVKKHTDKLDLIIHMSGVYDADSLIEIDENRLLRTFGINVFAIYRVNKVFFPLLKDNSKIIITSSELAPLDPLPFTGLYGISKSTIEKYAYSLRMELQLLNMKVIIIRPGAVETKLLGVSTSAINRFNENTKIYKHNAKKFLDITSKVEARKISPNKIAELAFKISKKKNPRYVYKINRNPLLLMLNILPQRLQNYIIKKILTSK